MDAPSEAHAKMEIPVGQAREIAPAPPRSAIEKKKARMLKRRKEQAAARKKEREEEAELRELNRKEPDSENGEDDDIDGEIYNWKWPSD